MASIGKFLASAFSVQAPSEYAGVGSSLTKLRRHDAEDGASHVTARKLAALFADEIPATTLLFKAYGHRATEISTSPTSASSTLARHGAFVDHAGTDGTTIWAAATSGQEALAIHLLACLLARIWAADEAVAVWYQLVQERKARLQEQISAGSTFHSSNLFAAKLELDRSQLVEWDANTRAWLSSADRVKRREQTQLRLVIDNVTLPISSGETLYESVMQTWITSMKMMEGLLSGESFNIRSGEVLLGLSSWHIYPNLSVIADQTTQVMQHDALVPEHVFVTVGLISKVQDSGSGIHWSLPLAHLRYYGKPVVRTRHTGLGQSRVPFEDVLFVALGGIFRTWQEVDNDFNASVDLLCLISDNILHIKVSVAPWLAPLDKACRRYKSLAGVEKRTAHQLMRLGYRFGQSFIASEKDQPMAAFGLTDMRYLLRICSTPDSRIKLLRYWARKNLKNLDKAVIRYFLPGSNIKRYALVDLPTKKRKRSGEDDVRLDHPEHWTHRAAQTGRIVHLGDGLRAPLHDPQSWTSVSSKNSILKQQTTEDDGDSVSLGDWLTQEFMRDLSDDDRELKQQQAQDDLKETQHQTKDRSMEPIKPTQHAYLGDALSNDYEKSGERDPDKVEDESETFWLPFPAWTHCDGEQKLQPYRFVGGIVGLAAIFVPGFGGSTTSRSNLLTCDQLEQFLKHDVKQGRSAFISEVLARHIWYSQLQKRHRSYVTSLQALHWASELYQHLPNAYIDLGVRNRPLHEAHFFSQQAQKLVSEDTEFDVKLRQTFSCVALFETGSINIPPMDFKSAMAICYQDSMYVAHRLLQDPSDDDLACLVTRIIGNIGKPGLSILHPPLAPEVRSFDAETSWHLANYQPFDGKFEDNFSGTSLHLSFTGSSAAYGRTTTGNIHQDVYLVETLIQVYDKGQWVADLDILGARVLSRHGWPSVIRREDRNIHSDLCAIDVWDELLGPPPSHAIFRAHKNWMARLAAATILAQQKRKFSIISCSEKTPNYSTRMEASRTTTRTHRAFDRDADDVLEPWLDPRQDNTGPSRRDDNFEAILGAEMADAEADSFFGSNESCSSDAEIDVDLSPDNGGDEPRDPILSPSRSPGDAFPDGTDIEGVFVLIS